MRRPILALSTAIAAVALPVALTFLSTRATRAQQPADGSSTAPASASATTAPSGFGLGLGRRRAKAPVADVPRDPMAASRGARHLLRNGKDYLGYGEYERALDYFREAEKRQSELSVAERKELHEGIHRAQMGIRGLADDDAEAVARAPRSRSATPARRPGGVALAARPDEPALPKLDPIQLTSASEPAPAAPDADPMELPPLPPAAAPAPAASAPVETPAPAAPEMPASAAPAGPAPLAEAPLEIKEPPPSLAAAPPALETPLDRPAPSEPSAPALEPPDPTPAPRRETTPVPAPAPPQSPAVEAMLLDPATPTPAPTAPAERSRPAPTQPAPAVSSAPLTLESDPPLPASSSTPETGAPPSLDLAPPAASPEPKPPTSAPASAPAPPPTARPEPAPAPEPLVAPEPAEPPRVAPVSTTTATRISESPGDTPALAPVSTSAPASEPPPAPAAEELPPLPPPSQPRMTTAPATPERPSSTRLDLGRNGSGLPAHVLREVQEIAQRQEDDARRNQGALIGTPAAPLSTGEMDVSGGRLELPRAPSPTEARPIRAIPIPEEFIPMLPRNWTPSRKVWAAAATCHMPLYFQDAVLERYGQNVEQAIGPAGRFLSYPLDDPRQSNQRNQILQPLYSIGLFGLQVAALPINLFLDPPWEAEYDLGYYRPGDRIPSDSTYLPLHGIGPPLRGRQY